MRQRSTIAERARVRTSTPLVNWRISKPLRRTSGPLIAKPAWFPPDAVMYSAFGSRSPGQAQEDVRADGEEAVVVGQVGVQLLRPALRRGEIGLILLPVGHADRRVGPAGGVTELGRVRDRAPGPLPDGERPAGLRAGQRHLLPDAGVRPVRCAARRGDAGRLQHAAPAGLGWLPIGVHGRDLGHHRQRRRTGRIRAAGDGDRQRVEAGADLDGGAGRGVADRLLDRAPGGAGAPPIGGVVAADAHVVGGRQRLGGRNRVGAGVDRGRLLRGALDAVAVVDGDPDLVRRARIEQQRRAVEGRAGRVGGAPERQPRAPVAVACAAEFEAGRRAAVARRR